MGAPHRIACPPCVNRNRSPADLIRIKQLSGRVRVSLTSTKDGQSWVVTTSLLVTNPSENCRKRSLDTRPLARPDRGPTNRARRRSPDRRACRSFPGRCRSNAATAAHSRRRRNSCSSSAAAIPMPAHQVNKNWKRRLPLLNELSAFLHGGVSPAPWHDRHRRSRVLRRPLDQLVGIDHVDERVPLGVAAANDLHLLEEQRAPLPEHIVALLQLALEMDRTDLPACQRNVRDLFSEPEPAFKAAFLGHGEMTGHAFDLWIVDAIGRKLVVGADELEHGGAAKDQIWFIGGRCRRDRAKQRAERREDQGSHGPGTPACGLRSHQHLQSAKGGAAVGKSCTEIMGLSGPLAAQEDAATVHEVGNKGSLLPPM